MAENAQFSISSITPYLAVKNAAQAIEFYKQAFGAIETARMVDNGKISHAEIRINNAPIYISDEWPESEALSPETVGGSPVMIVIETRDADTLFQQAVAAGASVSRPLQGGQNGDLRTGKVNDPFGHRWMILTRHQNRDRGMKAAKNPQGHDLPSGLSQPARRALASAGIENLEQVASFSKTQIKQLHGIGPKALEQLQQALRARDLSFAGDHQGG